MVREATGPRSRKSGRATATSEELRGLLAPGVLAEILRRILLARRTGVLHLAHGVERSDVEVRGGYLSHAETTLPGAHLGDLLVQIGFISARDRDACLEIAALSHERLGTSLLRHGLLNADHLAQGLALQLREVLARALVWRAGVFTFADTPAQDAADFERLGGPRIDPREVLLDATWTLISDPAIDALVGDLNRKVRKATDERLLYLDFRLSPADAFLLSRVGEEISAEKLLQLSPLPANEAKASLAGLLAVGAIEYVGAPPPTTMTTEIAKFEVARLAARITSTDPYEVLAVAPDAPHDDVRAAYLRLLRSCDPAATPDIELRPILRRMSEQLAAAYKDIERHRSTPRPVAPRRLERRRTEPALPQKEARPAPPRPHAPTAPVAARVEPSQALEAASLAFEAGRLHEALAILHDAIPQLQGRARGAARVRRARVLLAVDQGTRLAEDEIKTAIVEDPGNVEAHVTLGDIYRDGGSLVLAAKEYRKALDLQPRHAAAREALQELLDAEPAKSDAPSTLKRMFGRKP